MARLIRASLGAWRRTDPAGLRAPGAVHLNVEFADPLVPDPNSPVDVFQSGPLPQFWSSSIPNVVDAGPRTVLLVADGAGPIGDDRRSRGGGLCWLNPQAASMGLVSDSRSRSGGGAGL